MRKYTKPVFILLILTVLFSFIACGEEKKFLSMDLESLITNSMNTDNISTESEKTTTIGDNIVKIKSWIKGDKIKNEYRVTGEDKSLPSPLSIIDESSMEYVDRNAKTITSYKKGQESAVIQKLKENAYFHPFKILNEISENDRKTFKKISHETVENKKCMVFEGTVKDLKNTPFHLEDYSDLTYKIYFQEDTGLLSKCEIRSADKIISNLQIKSIKIGGVTEEMVDFPKDMKTYNLDTMLEEVFENLPVKH